MAYEMRAARLTGLLKAGFKDYLNYEAKPANGLLVRYYSSPDVILGSLEVICLILNCSCRELY